MKFKTFSLLFLLFLSIQSQAQITVFNGSNINISPNKILPSKSTPGDYHIVYSSVNSFGLMTYSNGTLTSNNSLHFSSTSNELPLGLFEIKANDFLIPGASWARTGNFTQSLVRLTNQRMQWAKGFSICDDFSNIGFVSGVALRDSFIYSVGSSRNTECGVIDLDFSAVKLNLRGEIQSQVSFIPDIARSTEGLFFLQPHRNIFYYGGFSTIAPCGGGNAQRPGLGTFDAGLQSRRWWMYEGNDFELNGALYDAHPLPSNPNRMVCNVRFSPDPCADTPVGVGLFVVDSLGNPVSAVRFRTNNTNDLLFCRYSKVVLSDESIVLAGRLTPANGPQRDFIMRTTPSGNVLFAKIIEPSNPVDQLTFEDFTVSGQKIILVGKLKTNGADNLFVLETDLNGVFPSGNNCVVASNLRLSTETLSIRKIETGLQQTQDMNSFDIPYRLSNQPINNLSCTICQSGSFAFQAKVDSTCANSCAGRIALQGRDSSAYTYLWSNGRNNASIGGLCPGKYTVTVTDNGGCTRDTSINIGSFNPIQVNAQIQNTCSTGCTGTIQLNPSGGSGALGVKWSNGATTANLSALCSGNYTTTITDTRGCLLTDTLTIDNTVLNFNLRILDPICTNPPSASIQVDSIVGGIAPYQFSLNGGNYGTANRFSTLVTGQRYNISVKDANQCELTKEIALPTVIPIVLGLPSLQPLRFGDTVQIVPTVTGGSSNLTYLWSLKKQENTLSCKDCPVTTVKGLLNDTIVLSLQDELGCKTSAFTLLQIIESSQVYIPNAFSPNKDQRNDVFTVFADPGAGTILLMRIFDRWGELVYEGANFNPNDLSKGWDGTFRGKLANQGIYVYVVEMQYRNGKSKVFKGDLHLLR